uniref:17S U2 SnRNP complex component HTATSF1 n=1 Tax=Steinernema glaseri TaxID=37863 RepID=A0A1I7Z912_9BILA
MGDDRRFIEGRWVAKSGDVFMEYVDDEWKAVTEESAPTLAKQWEEAPPSLNGQARSVVNGVTMIWNDQIKQWIPESEPDEATLAQYTLGYGVAGYSADDQTEPVEDGEKKEVPAEEAKEGKGEDKEEKPEENKQKRGPGWLELDESKCTTVYVSNLPTENFTLEDFMELMAKCGVIMDDPRTKKPKVKLYRDAEGNLKGDGTCCYVKHESVAMSLQILDETRVQDNVIKVERARFEMKGEYDPTKKRRKLTKSQRKRFEESQNKIFGWEPEKSRAYRPVCECTVVIKHLFTLEEAEADVLLAEKLKEEVTETCSRYGLVKKVHVFENNPDGVVTVTFDNVECSDQAVRTLNGRVVKGRTLEVSLWDGKTKYTVAETEEQRERRLRQWSDYLEKAGSDEEHQEEQAKTAAENNATDG